MNRTTTTPQKITDLKTVNLKITPISDGFTREAVEVPNDSFGSSAIHDQKN